MSKYVPYNADSIAYSRKLCKGIKDPAEKFAAIASYLERTVAYDYVRAAQIAKQKGQYPDVDRVWKTRMGICMDIAALATGMFRAVGIKSFYCVGRADGNRHAWVQCYIGKRVLMFDHSAKGIKPMKYVMERKY